MTTYRVDGEYLDGRHPSEVTFTASLKEDLQRRDFTINAMAYSETEGLQDYFGGFRDLQNGVIRAVGDPVKRFGEDSCGSCAQCALQPSWGIQWKRIHCVP